MHARVVRFNDVDPERVAEVVARIESDGPPPRSDAESVEMLWVRRVPVTVVVRFEDVERIEATTRRSPRRR